MLVKDLMKILKKANPDSEILISYLEDGYRPVSADVLSYEVDNEKNYVELNTEKE